MTHDGQHNRCADCAIARVRNRPPRLAPRYRASIRTFGDLWAMIGVVMAMERSRRKRRIQGLRLRWRRLPARYRQGVWRRIVERKADDPDALKKTIEKLEEMTH